MMRQQVSTCGALRAYIVQHYLLLVDAVVVQVGDAEPWVVRPFDVEETKAVFALSERRVLVVSSNGRFVTYDAVARELVREGKPLPSMLLQDRLLLTRDCRYVFSAGRSWRLIDVDTLAPAVEFDANWRATELAERADGAFVLLGHSGNLGDEERRTRIAIASRTGEVRVREDDPCVRRIVSPYSKYTIENRFEHLSPCGRWLLRFHLGSVSMRGAVRSLERGVTRRLLDRLAGRPAHNAIIAEQIRAARIDLVLELWSVEPFAFVRRITVDEAALERLTGNELTPESATAAALLPQVKHELDRAVSKKDADQIRKLVQRSNELTAAGRAYDWGREALLAFSEAAAALDPDEWRPDMPAVVARLPHRPGLPWLHYVTRLVSDVFWDEDGEAFRVVLKGNGRRRFDLQGRQLPDGEWRDPRLLQAPDAVAAQARALIEDEIEVTIPLAGLDEASCAAAIDALAGRIAADLPGMIRKEMMRVRFRSREAVLSEPEFFAHVAERCHGAMPALRRLWQAFNSRVQAEQWPIFDAHYDETTGALSHAALALARLDTEAYKLLETWFALRDLEHEPFGREAVLPAIASTNGWATREAVEFGLRAIAREEAGGPHGATKGVANGLLDRARLLFTPGEFAAALDLAGKEVAWSDDPETVHHCRAALVKIVRPAPASANLWDRRLLETLETAAA